MSDDHDHSGDHLGVEAPVESIRVNEITFRDFATPSSFLVYQGADGDTWYGLRTDTQDVEFVDVDGAAVINAALQQLATEDDGGSGRRGVVRVTGNTVESPTRMVTSTPIEHTVDGSELVLEDGVIFDYQGTEEAVLIGADRARFEAYHIESAGKYGIRDLGLTNAEVFVGFVRGGTDSLWLSDAPNQTNRPTVGDGRTTIHVAWAIPEGDLVWEMTSAPDAAFRDYRIRGPILFGADEAGIVLGDESDAQTVNHNTFYVDVDGRNGPRFVVNDSHNVVYLKDYVPGSLLSPDVHISPSAEDTTVIPDCVRGWPAGLITKRRAITATDLSKFDPFRPEVMAYDLRPDSLERYETVERNGGSVDLFSGFVEQRTGAESGSWANVRRHDSQNYGRLKFFFTWGAVGTNVWVGDNTNQEAWLLWGDREGPGVGWHIVDDTLYGFFHDRESATTVPLRSGFDPGVSWNLTAFYNPGDEIQYWVQETETGLVESSEPEPARPKVEASFDTREDTPDGSHSVSIPDEDDPTIAHQVVAIDLTTTESAEKAIRWSSWRNHLYPLV